MSNELLLSNVIPFAGSGLVGYALVFVIKNSCLDNFHARSTA